MLIQGAAFGELSADGVPEPMRGDGVPAGGVDQACCGAGDRMTD
jgi:hypothetical protein